MTFLKQVRWIILVFVLLGLLLSLSGEHLKPYSKVSGSILEHFGTALIIAGIIGLFLEISEIKDFFESRLLALLSRAEFVEIVDQNRLMEIAVSAIAGVGKKRATNPHYERDDFAWTLAEVINNYAGRPYRKDLFETVEYSILELEEIKAMGLNSDDVPECVMKIITKSRYEVVPPSEHDEFDFEFDLIERSFLVPGLDPGRHFSLKLKVNGDEKDEKWEGSISAQGKLAQIEIDRFYKLRGTASVEVELTQLSYGTSGHIVNYVTQVTHNATVHFSSRHSLNLQADVFGVMGNYNEPSITENSVSLQYTGWVLPGQGYYIAWRSQSNPQVDALKAHLEVLNANLADRFEKLPAMLAETMAAQKPIAALPASKDKPLEEMRLHDVAERLAERTSVVGRLLLYACYLSNKNQKMFSLADLAQHTTDKSYLFGYFIALSGAGLIAYKSEGEKYQILRAMPEFERARESFALAIEKQSNAVKSKFLGAMTWIENTLGDN
jgi:hypothetical protein